MRSGARRTTAAVDMRSRAARSGEVVIREALLLTTVGLRAGDAIRFRRDGDALVVERAAPLDALMGRLADYRLVSRRAAEPSDRGCGRGEVGARVPARRSASGGAGRTPCVQSRPPLGPSLSLRAEPRSDGVPTPLVGPDRLQPDVGDATLLLVKFTAVLFAVAGVVRGDLVLPHGV